MTKAAAGNLNDPMGIKEFSFELWQAEVIKTNRTTNLFVK
jgi:hypothetical protein